MRAHGRLAVYSIAADGMTRHRVPNELTLLARGEDLTNVELVTEEKLRSFPEGKALRSEVTPFDAEAVVGGLSDLTWSDCSGGDVKAREVGLDAIAFMILCEEGRCLEACERYADRISSRHTDIGKQELRAQQKAGRILSILSPVETEPHEENKDRVYVIIHALRVVSRRQPGGRQLMAPGCTKNTCKFSFSLTTQKIIVDEISFESSEFTLTEQSSPHADNDRSTPLFGTFGMTLPLTVACLPGDRLCDPYEVWATEPKSLTVCETFQPKGRLEPDMTPTNLDTLVVPVYKPDASDISQRRLRVSEYITECVGSRRTMCREALRRAFQSIAAKVL